MEEIQTQIRSEISSGDRMAPYRLDPTQKLALESFLKSEKRISPIEKVIEVENMSRSPDHFHLRVKTNGRSFTLKQSQSQPFSRFKSEATFYRAIQGYSLAEKRMPTFRFWDEKNSILSLENLGNIQNFEFLYREGILREKDIETLASYLLEIHRVEIAEKAKQLQFSNRATLEANAEEIFKFPLQNLNEDAALKEAAEELFKIYLNENTLTLLHGHFRPSSWLKSPRGLKIMSPDLCFLGPREFDLGVCFAHLTLARQPKELIEIFLKWYATEKNFDMSLVRRFAGMEIMRVLIGKDPVATPYKQEEKEDFLDRARAWVVRAQ